MERSSSFGSWLRRRRKALDLTQIEADEGRSSKQLAARLADCLGLRDEERAAFIKVARAAIAADRLAPPQLGTGTVPADSTVTSSGPFVLHSSVVPAA
jgi:hypothetical protein